MTFAQSKQHTCLCSKIRPIPVYPMRK
jgi:hypothetical protein